MANVDHYSPFIALHLQLFKCSEEECLGRAFRSRSELCGHNARFHGLEQAPETSLRCPHEGCPSKRQFKASWSLEDHLFKFHGGKRPDQDGSGAGIPDQFQSGQIQELPDDTDAMQCDFEESEEEGDEVEKVEGLMSHVQFFPRGPDGEVLSFSGL